METYCAPVGKSSNLNQHVASEKQKQSHEGIQNASQDKVFIMQDIFVRNDLLLSNYKNVFRTVFMLYPDSLW